MPAPRKKPNFSSTSPSAPPSKLQGLRQTGPGLGEDLNERLEDEEIADLPPSPVPTLPEEFESAPAPAPLAPRQKTAELIAEPPAPAAPAPAEPAPAPATPAAPRSRLGLGTAELAALGGFALIALIGTLLFFKYLYKADRGGRPIAAERVTSLPVKGALATVKDASLFWRDRREGDRGKTDQIILPAARLVLDPGASKTGYVRVQFYDPSGELRGDVMTLKFEGGKFKPANRGETLSADGSEATIAGTEGFASRTALQWYLGNSDPRWTVRLHEGADYSKGPWTPLTHAEIANRHQ